MLKKLNIKYILAFALAAIASLTVLTLSHNWQPAAQAQNQTPTQNQTPIQSKPAELSNKAISFQNAGLKLEEVAQGVYALVASTDFPPASPAVAICNGGIVIGSDSVLVIDPFQTLNLPN